MKNLLDFLFLGGFLYVHKWAWYIIAACLFVAIVIEKGENDGMEPVSPIVLGVGFALSALSALWSWYRETKNRKR